MNKTVSMNNIGGFSLRIKTTNTDILYGVMETKYWSQDIARPQVTFAFTPEYVDSNGDLKNYENILNKLTVGSFYKVQLAYIDKRGIVGYYSTVAIIKYTSQPTVEIAEFDLNKTNINPSNYLGIYKNLNDPSEKAYKYRFNLYTKDGQLLETSDWRFHNSYEDTSLTQSIDSYILNYALNKNILYKIEYQVITNNGLQLNSPRYLLMEAESISPEFNGALHVNLNYENACIELGMSGQKMPDGQERIVTGAFLLSRASSLDNYATWLPISNFRMSGEKPSSFLLKDYTIMQGVTYIYSLQQFNDYGIYSNRILSKYVEAQFEDAFLFDGQRQLRIRFNPKVASFKTVVQESKKNTLGSRFPYIFRNGATYYKEFPISGLISYYMDENESFLSKEKDLYITDWKATTDIVDENVLLERLFKLKVMEWLNDGKPKLFKSPQEGNYIVRLMNCSLTPIDTVSRMLHTFNCQATEIAEYTPENLITYKLLDTEDIPAYQMRWETIVFQNILTEKRDMLADALKKYNEGFYDKQEYDRKVKKIEDTHQIYGVDLFRGYEVYHLKIQDMIMGTSFSFLDSNLNVQTLMIGATGAYEAFFDEPIKELRLLSMNNAANNNRKTIMSGSITFGIKTASQNRFDIITKVDNLSIPIYQIYGPHDNILYDYSNLKRKITRINYARFTRLPVEEIYSSLFATNINGNIMNGLIKELSENDIYDIISYDSKNQKQHNYYRYYNGKLYAYPHFITEFDKPIEINSYTFYRDSNTELIYYLYNTEFIDITDKIDMNGYQLKESDLNIYTIYHKRYQDPHTHEFKEQYFKYDGIKLNEVEYSTEIIFGDVSIDVKNSRVREIHDIDNVPTTISIGSGVQAELGILVKIITYSVENYTECEEYRINYEKALLNYNVLALGLLEADKNNLQLNTIYRIWNGYTFKLITLNPESLIEYSTGGKLEDIILYESPTSKEVSAIDIQEAYKELDKQQKSYFHVLEELLNAEEVYN